MKRIVFAVAMLTLSACGGSGSVGSSTDPRAVAIQKQIDQHQGFAVVFTGQRCYALTDPSAKRIIGAYRSAGATVVGPKRKPATQRYDVPENCWTATWPSGDVATPGTWDEGLFMGHYVVDKVGDEQAGPMGTKITPFRAHFVLSNVGKAMVAGGISQAPPDLPDGQAVMHKDADGNWVAQ